MKLFIYLFCLIYSLTKCIWIFYLIICIFASLCIALCSLNSFRVHCSAVQCSAVKFCALQCGKNLVFAMTIKLIPEFWRNQEIPEKFWKRYEQVKPDLFQKHYLFLILLLIPEFCHPKPRPPYNLTWHIMFSRPKKKIFFLLFIT